MNEMMEDAVQDLIRKYGRAPLNPAFVMVGDKDPNGPAAYFRENGVDRTITYGELVVASARWARYLRQAGVEAGTRVAGFLPKGPALLSLALGVWRLGAIYVPLFTAFGPDAVGYRLDHSGAHMVVTTPDLATKIPEDTKARVATVDAIRSALDPLGVDDWVLRTPDDPFILIYTSGTTGRPKGCRCRFAC